jgi:hypothetical protein
LFFTIDDCFRAGFRGTADGQVVAKTGTGRLFGGRGGVVRLHGGITRHQRQTNGKGRAIVGGKEQRILVGIFCQTPQQGQGGFGKKKKKIPQNKQWREMGNKNKM